MTNLQTRDSFIFYRSFYEAIQDLPKENQLELYNAIAQYSLNFEDPKLNGLSNTIFKLIKPQLDANNKRFINGQKGAEHGKKGAEHGKKGGRPRKETPLNIKNNPPKNPPNNNVNDNVNVNDNENKLIVQNENHFEQFWQHYTPIETSIGSKAKAKKKYQEYLKKYTHDQILKAMQRYIDHCKKNKQKTKMCYGFFDEHLESYMNVKEPINKEEDKIQKLKAINEIAGQKLFSSVRQLLSNDTTVFLFMKNDDDEQALRNLPESKRNQIKDILKDMLENKELKIQIANFHI